MILLVGTIFGQLLFGSFADVSGRLKTYSWDLILVLFAAVFLAEISTGSNNSMSIRGWLCFWSFFVGVGTGAGRTLSAVVTAEFAPARSRARTMAGVFLMQPLGRLTSAAMSLLMLETLGNPRGLALEKAKANARVATIDSMWRFVVGVGSIPALIALCLCLTVSESHQSTLDVNENGPFSSAGTNTIQESPSVASNASSIHDTEMIQIRRSMSRQVMETQNEQLVQRSLYSGMKQYFWAQGNWRHLAGISACSLLFEIAYSGLGANDPLVLAQVWSSHLPTNSTSRLLDWGDPSQPYTSIYQTLRQDAIHSMMVVSAGSMVGSIALILSIDYISRKKLFVWSFLGLAFLFAIAGGCLFKTSPTNPQALETTLYILTQILSNIGPNALTFIIPAEIFPTRYRSTCHGISASFGTFGSIIIQMIIYCTSSDGLSALSLRVMLIVFSTLMFCGAVIAWAWIPEGEEMRKRG
ncbi:MFS general substrate transporter [Cadophora sp. DSE1049]|nr:MFS general substrate transporter [Cadophora sp. DSE1049]